MHMEPPPSPLDLPPSVPGMHSGLVLPAFASELSIEAPLAPNCPAPRRQLSNQKSAAPAPAGPPVDYNRAKRHELDLVRAFEGRRSAFYVEQYHTHHRYWQAFVALIREQRDCTDRLLVWYRKRVHAYRAFAAQLFAVNDAVLGQRRGMTRLTSRRSSSDGRVGGVSPVVHVTKHRTQRSKSLGAYGASAAVRPAQTTTGGTSKSSRMLDELCAMDCSVAKSIEELCDFLETSVIEVLSTMAQQSAELTDALIKEGDRAMSTMQGVDVYTAKSFESCHRTAAGILLAPGEGGPPAASGGKESGGGGAAKRSSEVHDMWLADMHYRVAARQQEVAWQDISALMTQLFARLREVEINRKSVTKELLATTLLRTNQLWQQLPGASAHAITCLQGISLEVDELEREIAEGIKMHNKQPSVSSGNNSSVSSIESRRSSTELPTRASSGSITDIRPSPDTSTSGTMEALGLPLPSPLVLHAAVLERKGEGVVNSLKGAWVPCLVVLTADQFLHIFETKPETDPATASPESAFAAVLPQITAADNFRGRRGERDAMVHPVITLDVRHHMVAPRDSCTKSHHLCQFGVTEVSHNAGIKGLFKGESFRRLSLRTRSFHEMKEWVAKIRACAVETIAGPEERFARGGSPRLSDGGSLEGGEPWSDAETNDG
eukprot:TRINITY_DN13427_c0_g2_i2.p1 TRINITY_DN13427_c0_g2~~TRINITY_DN13427_c0_g2_i2.p1  ORF type:complete len:661 (+),score=118.83 TRINITY_DN13427_c0_g2_i2:48-2030(+)